MPLDAPLTKFTPLLTLCLVLSSLTACAEFPEVGVTARAATTPAPQLVPIDGILVQADALRPAGAAIGGIEARAAALRARAARLRRM